MDSFPPSPALSVCDSLDDIDDLDAFLDAQGPLSQFATPPLKEKAITVAVSEISNYDSDVVTVSEVLDDDSDSDDEGIDCEYHVRECAQDSIADCVQTVVLPSTSLKSSA